MATPFRYVLISEAPQRRKTFVAVLDAILTEKGFSPAHEECTHSSYWPSPADRLVIFDMNDRNDPDTVFAAYNNGRTPGKKPPMLAIGLHLKGRPDVIEENKSKGVRDCFCGDVSKRAAVRDFLLRDSSVIPDAPKAKQAEPATAHGVEQVAVA